MLHFSYDRVFQTPSSENILLSSSGDVDSLNPSLFLRLPVPPSQGDYYEAGFTKALLSKLKLDVNSFRRNVGNFADDDQIENTSISFPISFRRASIYGVEGKLDVPDWNGFSGFLSYSYQVGHGMESSHRRPVPGARTRRRRKPRRAATSPITQDQRNTARGRARYQVRPRLWAAGGVQFDSGLPFQFDGDAATVLAEYGPRVLSRINFQRGRIYPSISGECVGGRQSVQVRSHQRWSCRRMGRISPMCWMCWISGGCSRAMPSGLREAFCCAWPPRFSARRVFRPCGDRGTLTRGSRATIWGTRL